jgi:pilus assembly protein CpaD
MSKSHHSASSRHLVTALLLGAGVLLTGCSNAALVDDYPTNDAYYERYPITVEKAPVKLGVSTHAHGLRPEQINAVAAFARDAHQNAHSRIYVRYPSGSKNGRAVASSVGQLLVQQGVSPGMITASSYKGGAGAPVEISYTRYVAVTKECGDWSSSMAVTFDNLSYPNFGCSQQNNLAAMVANPEDFEHPRAMPPVRASARKVALDLYFNGGGDSGSSSSTSGSGTSSSSGGTSGGTGG